jgi:hypothetical protein
LNGIDQNIEQYLLDTPRIGPDRRQVGIECRRAFKTDPLAVGICTQI